MQAEDTEDSDREKGCKRYCRKDGSPEMLLWLMLFCPAQAVQKKPVLAKRRRPSQTPYLTTSFYSTVGSSN